MSAQSKTDILKKIEENLQKMPNPANLYSGVKLESSLWVNNVVLFKRTWREMAHPTEVSHNYHHRFVLVLPIKGAGYVHVDGFSYFLKPGLVYMVFPYQFHHFLNTQEDKMLWFFMTFECKALDVIAPLKNSIRVLNQRTARLVAEMLRENSENKNFELVYKATHLVWNLLGSHKLDEKEGKKHNEDDGKGKILQQINRYVRENLNKALTISDVAGHTGYSVSYLRAVFRKELGVSLGAYMRNSRLSVAAAMLSRPDRPSIEEIAVACGFTSIYAFSHAFKKATGVAPSIYSSMLS